MSNETSAAPAGDGNATPVTATTLEPMTAEAASALLAGWDNEDTSSDPSPSDDADDFEFADDTAPEGEDGEAEATAAPEETEPAEYDEASAQPDDGIDWEKVPGTAKFRLRDGTVVTAADLKQNFDELRQARQMREALEQQRLTFQRQMTQAAQQYQQFLPVAQQAINAIQASLPQVPNPPDPRLAQADPLGYVEQKAQYDAILNDYNVKVGQMRAIQAQAVQQQQRAQVEQRQRLDGYIEEQRKALLDALPDLRDQAKRQEFYRDFLEAGTNAYGFSADELNAVYDARIMRMAADALAYRRMMARGKAAQPRPAQAQAKRPPVAQGGRRETPQEQTATRKEKLMSDARKKGSLDARSAARLLAQLES